MTQRTPTPETTVCPDCKGRGYTESIEGHHLVCTCFYERQEAVERTTLCDRCGGAGRLRSDEPECNEGRTSTDCERCGGSGRLAQRRHEWGPSRVGHGEAQCIHCLMTNREAWVLGGFCING